MFNLCISFVDYPWRFVTVAADQRDSLARLLVEALASEEPDAPAAEGHFTHVYVGRDSRRPVPLPEAWREKLETLR